MDFPRRRRLPVEREIGYLCQLQIKSASTHLICNQVQFRLILRIIRTQDTCTLVVRWLLMAVALTRLVIGADNLVSRTIAAQARNSHSTQFGFVHILLIRILIHTGIFHV